MTRFQFRLDSVLAWRRAQLEAEEFKLRQLLDGLVRIERAAGELEAVRLSEERRVIGAGTVTGAELWSLAAWREAARVQAGALAREREVRLREIAGQRERIAVARQRCRLLERLREKRLAEWSREIERQLDAFASEAYLARWNAS